MEEFRVNVKRRTLLGALGLAAVLPRFAAAQPARPLLVILLSASESADDEPATRSFFDQLRRLGWIEGQNITYERLYGKGMRAYLESLAKDAVSRTPDLIFAASASIARTVQNETDVIPVVFSTASDPVAGGLVDSLPRPGRNATGVYQPPGDVVLKRFQLAREVFPQLKRIGAVFDRRATGFQQQKDLHQSVAHEMRMELKTVEFNNYEVVPKALSVFRKDKISVVMVPGSLTLFARRREVITAAARNSVVLITTRTEWVEAGAVLSFGAEISEGLRRAARITDRVLKGAPIAEIPVEQVNKFELAVNVRSAHALAIDIPKAVVLRAGLVIR
jgi:putative ABC transport system substrate-binding protein